MMPFVQRLLRCETTHSKKSQVVMKGQRSTTQSAISSESEEPKEEHHPLNLNLSMHRLFTFPLRIFRELPFDYLVFLAELGLCYECKDNQEFLQSEFRDFKINLEEIAEYFSHGAEKFKKMISTKLKEANCEIDDSDNVPMGNVDIVLNYKFEAHRLYSLLKYPHWRYVEPCDLARSGFYYTGDGDNARCAFCNLEVSGWEDGDEPDTEHTRWNPNCPFMLKDPLIFNIPIGRELQEVKHDSLSMMGCIGANPFDSKKKNLKNYGGNIQLVKSNHFIVTPQDLNIHDLDAPLNPKFLTLHSRIDSYKEFWPKSKKLTPRLMAEAGYFHSGKGDRAICFHCNLGLKDWDLNDDPFIQHCKWNSSCQYLLMRKGQDFVEKVLRSAKNKEEIANAPTKRCTDGDIHCLNCRLDCVSKVNLPCGHMTFCSSCPANDSCMVCGLEVIAEVKVPGFSNSETGTTENNVLSSLTDEAKVKQKQIGA
ncbi:baculoviral IAP repeat-containing protein 7-B-like [Cloeon dipterum]|uniref:baculoviral IAP repeat-containing protein 7-B-like n=1 Tax=Cloeon dipterum TaxID=197152 RepID=UPI00321F8C93